MSQHDFDIANQSAPNFRSDLNNAIQALASLSSGATAPATTYANMLWYDSANDLLKMRNESDSAWITIGALNQSTNKFEVDNIPSLSEATWEAGTSTDEAGVSPAKIKAAIAALSVAHTASLSTTSGTSRSLTGIPSGVTAVDFFFNGVSLNTSADTGDMLIQLGTSSGFLTSGYSSVSKNYTTSRSSTAGFIFLNPGLSSSLHGICRIRKIGDGTDSWVATGEAKIGSSSDVTDSWSDVFSVGAPLTQVRLTTVGGTAVFDAGGISIRCYY